MNMSLSKKLSLFLFVAFIAAILYTYLFSNVLYERLYVKSVEEEMLETGKSLSVDYTGGPVSNAFVDQIAWYNERSKFEIFAVRNPRELSMCIPFELDYDALIGGEDRTRLLGGEVIFKKGYEERFDRDVISVIVPLLHEKRLEGIIYLYYPLAKLADLTFKYTMYWLLGTGIFLILALSIGTKWLQHMVAPLYDMKSAAEQLSDGNLSIRVKTVKDDEIGQLGKTFNEMAESIQKEDEQRKEFLANVSHELRTPLSYIKGYTEAIQMGMITEEETGKYHQIILRESKRMERLVNDLLDLAKLDANEFSLTKMPLPLAQTIEETVAQIQPRLKDKNIRLLTALDYDVIVEADEGRLDQLFMNILDNAIRYTPFDGKIQVTLEKNGDGFCSICIEDNGPGIPKADLKHITERFYRVNKARTRKEGGTGLGLSIVERLTKLHGGMLKVDSEYGKGTKITIYLPLLQEND